MKKTLLTAIALLYFMVVSGQGFGVQLGFNVSKFKSWEKGERLPNVSFISHYPIKSVNFGVNYDYEVADHLFFKGGLLFIRQGLKILTEGEGGISSDGKELDLTGTFKINYLYFPVALKYNIEIADEVYIAPSLGMYLGFAMGGELEVDNGESSNTEKLKFGSSSNSHFKSGDMGLMLQTSLLYKNFELGIVYLAGTSDIVPDKDNVTKNSSFGILLGYRFF